MIGKKFNRWTVIGDAGRDSGYKKKWLCICDCGTQKVLDQYSMTSGDTKSCGCHRAEVSAGLNLKHGMAKSKEFSIWQGIKNRCYNENVKAYRNYGGRGIRVCDSWLNSFESFLNDMGPVPEGMEIDRINNNGNYEPNNCRWVTRTQNARNRNVTRRISWNGMSLTIIEWSERLGVSASAIAHRLYRNWSVSDIFTQPFRIKEGNKYVYR